MKISKRKVIILSILVFMTVLSLAGISIIKSIISKPENILKILPPQADLQIKDFVYTEVGESNAKWEVKAKTALYDKKQNLASFNEVEVKLTTAEKKVYFMRGDRGKMHTEKKDIEIEGNVLIISDADDRFKTDYLKYSHAEKKFFTDALVTMENKRAKISGTGFVLFMDAGELKLLSSVKAIIN